MNFLLCILLGLAGFAALMSAAPAVAKEPPSLELESMKVIIARSAAEGCEPNCPEWIAAQGAIDAQTLRAFKRVLSGLGNRKLPILVDSAGGSVDDALAIGRLIRAKGLDVVVAKTVPKVCGRTDAVCKKFKQRDIHLALPQTTSSKCASSCAFILAAGTQRYAGAPSRVGLHQISTFNIRTKILRIYRVTTRYLRGVPVESQKSLVSETKVGETRQATPTPESVYQKIRVYFAEMGIGDDVMPILLSTPNTKIRWLRDSELMSTRLATAFVTGEQLLAPPRAVAAPAPAPVVPAALPASSPDCASAATASSLCPPGPANLPVPEVPPETALVTPQAPPEVLPVAPAAVAPAEPTAAVATQEEPIQTAKPVPAQAPTPKIVKASPPKAPRPVTAPVATQRPSTFDPYGKDSPFTRGQ